MLKNRLVISKNSRLQTDSIDIWAADVDRSGIEIQHYAGLLSDEESARSAKFRATRHRKCYIVRHGILRELLSAYLSCRPSELKIFTDSKGKPYVVDSVLETPLQFSMSHSAGLAVFAFSRSAAIGVDIERIFGFPELREIASQHFTPAEIKEVDCCPESNRVEVFFKLWARKEAVLKANGEGLALPLRCVDVSTQITDVGTWSVLVEGDITGREYQLTDVIVAPGFATAVAVCSNGKNFTVAYRRYNSVEWA